MILLTVATCLPWWWCQVIELVYSVSSLIWLKFLCLIPLSPFFPLGGNSLNNLIELKTININPTDTTVSLLNDCTEVSGDDFFWLSLYWHWATFLPCIKLLYFKILQVYNLNLLFIRSAWKRNKISFILTILSKKWG